MFRVHTNTCMQSLPDKSINYIVAYAACLESDHFVFPPPLSVVVVIDQRSKKWPNKPKKKIQSMEKCKAQSDDEIELLLRVTINYKASRLMENIDLESYQIKYQDIMGKYLENCPSPEETAALENVYPHTKEENMTAENGYGDVP